MNNEIMVFLNLVILLFNVLAFVNERREGSNRGQIICATLIVISIFNLITIAVLG